MKRELNVQVRIDPMCTLSALDCTSYTYFRCGLDKHISLEYLFDRDDNLVSYKILPLIPDEHHRAPTTFKLPNDGTYTYYKLIIPTLDHFHKVETIDSTTDDSFEIDDTWEVSGKYFFYNGKFYYSDKDLATASDVNGLKIVTDLAELWSKKDEQGFFYFEDCIFSICKLEKCLISLQKQVIENCYSNKCGSDADLKNRRDFILDSVFVLRYMLSLRQYVEAQRILDNLSSCDGALCDDGRNNSSSGCGCGRVV